MASCATCKHDDVQHMDEGDGVRRKCSECKCEAFKDAQKGGKT